MFRRIIAWLAARAGLLPRRSSITIIGCYFDQVSTGDFFRRLSAVLDEHDGAVDVFVEERGGEGGDEISLSVVDYGAVGDGETDDASALQRAIDAAKRSR